MIEGRILDVNRVRASWSNDVRPPRGGIWPVVRWLYHLLIRGHVSSRQMVYESRAASSDHHRVRPGEGDMVKTPRLVRCAITGVNRVITSREREVRDSYLIRGG